MSSTPSLSGRAMARAHRQAQKSGKTASAAATRPTAKTTVSAAKAPARRPAATTANAPASAAGRDAAKQRRAQQKSGKTSQAQGTANPHPKAKAKMIDREPIVQPREQASKPAASRPANARKVKPNNQPVQQSGGRNVARAWRKAGAKGKAGQNAMKTNGTSSGSIAKMSNPDASTREIARKVRAERCTKGKSGCKPAETAGAKRARASKERSTTPAKVGESSTLRGQSVSGTQVGQGRAVMTGAETGACKVVSGTEYLAQEEFVSHCNTQPSAGPAKVSQSQTTRGQVVSGNEVGNSDVVTGDQAGQCSAVTGTEYIPADQAATFCGADAAAKGVVNQFTVMSQPSNAGRSAGVTGGDSYKSQSTTIRPSNGPSKVVMSATAMGNMTSGTQVGRLEGVTGSESGQCKNVTGTGYQSAEESQTLCGTEAAPTANKVTTSGTSRGQIVTGDRSGGNFDMTGAQAGACQAVSGTAYAGAEMAASCSPEQAAQIEQRIPRGVNPAISGVQPGPMGLTGAQKGACNVVSGTHYQGTDQTNLVCDSANAAQIGQSDYPQMMGQQPVMPVAQPQVQQQQPASAITGDAWDRGSKVTGTEGPWASQRNSSLRGAAGQAPMGASQFRPVAMEEVPQSPITGSSGNTEVGAKVTLSGGARA